MHYRGTSVDPLWKGGLSFHVVWDHHCVLPGKYSPWYRPSYFFPPLQSGATKAGRTCRLLSVISDSWFADGLRRVSVCACPVGRTTSSPTSPRLSRWLQYKK